jgi:hypothetical protein
MTTQKSNPVTLIDPAAEAAADARLRALFADTPKAPMGDEAFVAKIMRRTEAEAQRKRAFVSAGAMGLVGLLAAALIPHLGTIGPQIALAFLKSAPSAPEVSAQSMVLVGALVAAGAGWLYAERA